MIMTINEKNKLIKMFWDKVIEVTPQDIKSDTVKVVSDKDIEWLIEQVQPKTTSTDIDELKKEFEEKFDGDYFYLDEYKDGVGLDQYLDNKKIWSFFAPHLSNKSEPSIDVNKIVKYLELDGKLRCPRCGWLEGTSYGHCGLCEGHRENIVNWYTTHLSNKSELKKVLVAYFSWASGVDRTTIEKCSNEQEFRIDDFIAQYLSSNEKEEK